MHNNDDISRLLRALLSLYAICAMRDEQKRRYFVYIIRCQHI